jgi:hypothetical protein
LGCRGSCSCGGGGDDDDGRCLRLLSPARRCLGQCLRRLNHLDAGYVGGWEGRVGRVGLSRGLWR